MPEDNTNVVRLDLGLAMRPENVRGEGPSSALAREALTRLHYVASEIMDVSKTVQSKGRLADVVVGVSKKAIGRLDATTDKLKQHAKAHQTAIDAAISVKVDPHVAAEIRAHVRAAENPKSYATAAMRTDPRVASALLAAPGMLIGHEDKDMALLRDLAANTWAKEHVDKLAEVNTCLEHVDRARSVYTDKVAGLLQTIANDDNAGLARLAKAGE